MVDEAVNAECEIPRLAGAVAVIEREVKWEGPDELPRTFVMRLATMLAADPIRETGGKLNHHT